MATKEFMTLGGHQFAAFNLSGSVGPGGDNKPGDVLMVRAMFAYIAKLYPGKFAGAPVGELKPPFDSKFTVGLGKLIAAYQNANRKHLLRVDGVIHPASYYGRNIRAGEPQVMTITQMHHDCVDAGLMSNDGDYLDALPKQFPQAAGFFDFARPFAPAGTRKTEFRPDRDL